MLNRIKWNEPDTGGSKSELMDFEAVNAVSLFGEV